MPSTDPYSGTKRLKVISGEINVNGFVGKIQFDGAEP